jgi:predicted nucleotide-binding protein
MARSPDRTQESSAVLRVPLANASAFLDERIRESAKITEGEPSFHNALRKRERALRSWFEYNHDWLLKNIGAVVANEHAEYMAKLPPRLSTASGLIFDYTRWSELRVVAEDLREHLRSVKQRLGLWARASSGVDAVDDSGAIFVVHGRNMGRASEVARELERSTGRETTILNEQAHEGQTIIEKFESNAASAAFAAIVMTADDVGRLRESNVRAKPRARQNVVLELGYFIGKLGRRRVAVLVDEGIELPSDIVGLGYIALDVGGAWKAALRRELRAAGIHADESR